MNSVCKANTDDYYDHPSIDKIKKNKISNLVFIDDSIGSGGRIAKFVKSFFLSCHFEKLIQHGYNKHNHPFIFSK